MFVDQLLNQGNAPLLEHWVHFTAARHKLIAENVVNISTPNYRQKDLSVEKFQQMLGDWVAQRGAGGNPADAAEHFAEAETPRRGVLFHDGANRSMEQLMTDQAKNALMHNLAIELLRKQFQAMEMALRERVS